MFFARSGIVAATLLVLQSTLSIAAPLSEQAVHNLEKRITCQTTEVPITKQCLPCSDPSAQICNSTTTLSCIPGYTLFIGDCFQGLPYATYDGVGLVKPFAAKQQPLKPFPAYNCEPQSCPYDQPQARVSYYTVDSRYPDGSCYGQNGPLDQNLGPTSLENSQTEILLKGFCTDFENNPFVTSSGASCTQTFISSLSV